MNSPLFFSSVENPPKTGAFPDQRYIQCGLCPRRCRIAPGKEGLCRVRANRDGQAALPFYGFITALAVDPIEKKPLYHFRPGTEILSAGFAGCNLRCPFCQNWHISQEFREEDGSVQGRFYTPAELIAAAKHSVAYTYSEPLVHIEYLLDCMREAQKAGVANVLVSNGCITSEAAAEILGLCDAANIDLKCFSRETYAEVLGGDLSAVTGFIRMAVEKGVHLELTTLVVPGLNDSREELDKCRDFIAELETHGRAVPWHLSAYHPAHKWRAPPTDPFFLIGAAKRAAEKLTFVYTGNITTNAEEPNFSDTFCPRCGKILIRRRAYRVDTSGLLRKEENGKYSYTCAACGETAPVG